MKRLISILLFAGSAAFGASACGAPEEARELYNCARICEAYGDCVQETGAEYDELECISHCETQVDKSQEFKTQAAACQECIDMTDKTCVENAFECADECGEVILKVET